MPTGKLIFFFLFLLILSISSQENKRKRHYIFEESVEPVTTESDLLNKLLKNSKNIFQYIFPYLSLFQLELHLKCVSKNFNDLYKKFVENEKSTLRRYLEKKEVFEKNKNFCENYFNFFEKRIWIHPYHYEFVSVESFSEDLILLPKSIRQMIQFRFRGTIYKYILFKNGELFILKKLKNENNFVCISGTETNFQEYKNQFFSNIRYMECRNNIFFDDYQIDIYKINNFKQSFFHQQNMNKISVNSEYEVQPMIFLKNHSGFLTGTNFISWWQNWKQKNGMYQRLYAHGYKQNVKKINSSDYEHSIEEIPFIFSEQEEEN